jgi:hypothetical protein
VLEPPAVALPPAGWTDWSDPVGAGAPVLDDAVDGDVTEGMCSDGACVADSCTEGDVDDDWGRLTVGVVTGSRGTVTDGTVTVATVGVVTEGVVMVGVVTTGVDTVGTVSEGTEIDGTVSALLECGCQPSNATHTTASPSAPSTRSRLESIPTDPAYLAAVPQLEPRVE